MISEIPTFAEVWKLLVSKGRKELLAKKWQQYSPERKQLIFEKIKAMKVKPNPEEVIK